MDKRFKEGSVPMNEKLEDTSKEIVQLLKERFPDQNMGFISFVSEFGEPNEEGVSGNMGFTTNINQDDTIRMIMEWLGHVIDNLDRKRFISILEELKTERWGDDDGS